MIKTPVLTWLLAAIPIAIAVYLDTARAGSPPVPCVASPCQFSTNIAWDTAGEPDTRPDTWGNSAVVESRIPFVNVPAGYAVQVTHLSGDEVAAPHGTVNPNSMAYGLIGLTSSTPYQSPYVGPGLGSSGTFLYKQMPIPPAGGRIPIDQDVLGTLNADDVAIIKQALFLDTMGTSCHFEATLTIQFRYVANGSLSAKAK
jgi:hypothetical protein